MASRITLTLFLCLLFLNSSSAFLPTDLPFLKRQELDPNPDPTCTRGFRSLTGSALCCARQCRQCGGGGCNRPLGAASCCGGSIVRSGRSCDEVGPPCVASVRFPPPNGVPDPACENGISTRGVCCPAGCGRCGGAGCRTRTPPGAVAMSCCRGLWTRQGRFCDRVGAPCRIGSRPREPIVDNSRWVTITGRLTGRPTGRHEACMAWLNGRGYLIGGRNNRTTEIFDPAMGTWTKGANVGVELHHMQCVGWRGRIWIVSAWTGGFPREREVDKIYVYNVNRDRWSTRPGLPERRRRGGAAQVLFDNKIYVMGGNRGGHGAHATTLGWTDYYDLVKQEWVTDLADLPVGRDHFQGAKVNGVMICVSGGRDGGSADFFTETITSTFCYTPSTGRWQDMEAPLPGAGRGGTTAVTTCRGELMVVGGERLDGPASAQVDVFDGREWRTSAALNRGRHGGGLVVSNCRTCGRIFAVSGSGNRGGGPELDSTEMYLVDGEESECEAY